MRFKGDLILLTTALLWGSAFAAQRFAAGQMGPFFFNASRFLLGALFLLPLTRYRLKLPPKKFPVVILAGSLLFAGSALQQAGMATTTAGNAGFITGLYVVLVPVLLSIFWHKKLSWAVWVAAMMATVGIYLLSTGGHFRPVPGDWLELTGALFWAVHVILIGLIANDLDPVHFSIGQFLICGALNLCAVFLWESNPQQNLTSAWWTILYTALFSIAIGFTLQTIGQRYAPSTDAAIILSMEAVFAAFFGWLFLGEKLLPWQLLGCILIMGAIFLAQIKLPTPLSQELSQNELDL